MIALILLVSVIFCVLRYMKTNIKKPPLIGGALPIVGHTFKFMKILEGGNYLSWERERFASFFIMQTAKDWNALPPSLFPNNYNLDIFKSRVNIMITMKLLFEASAEIINLGGVALVRIATIDIYGVVDPEDVHTVLNSCLEKDVIYNYFKPWLGEGLIAASEQTWKRHRKLLVPTFNQKILDGFLSEYNVQARLLVNALEAEVGRGKFDPTPYLEHATLQTICSTAMGATNDETDKELRAEYLDAKSKFQDGIVVRSQTFWLQSDFIYNLTGLNKVQGDHARKLHGLTNAIIKKRKADIRQELDNQYGFKPFMDLLLDMENDGILTEKEVQEEVDSFTFAGSDTLSISLSLVLLLVGSYPGVQEKIVEELDEVFQESDRNVEKQDLHQLNYLDAVVKETLRMYPVVPVVARTIDKNLKLKNYTLPSGSRCFVSLYGVNRHTSWGPDAEEFRPERWLQPASLPIQLASFGSGRRRCIGYNYAMMTLKTFLVHLLRRYRVCGDVTSLVLRMEVLAKPAPKDYISLEMRAT